MKSGTAVETLELSEDLNAQAATALKELSELHKLNQQSEREIEKLHQSTLRSLKRIRQHLAYVQANR